MRHSFLRDHRPDLYQQLILSGNLREHLMEIDQTSNRQMDLLIRQMAEAEGASEDLKSSNQLGWIARMNSIHHRAEEIILKELIFT